ncbi:MAG: Probable Co/Zn/Cd efflux system membrane fusion protein [uncultured Thiotrichaceae bacterium]|uniref:Probable Co/Zn/Cd efflux system membrane fusion protein n=1 Tax=uncultured Thiotrichaceae bacterium TaxID=298394 RepID=A0A6S6SNE3_9GAMM|nr:MAG: Probable Co/Zn/Cd efflux system membrane fusion protein [uncultured Thiotrichaceae bacterium]
MSRTIHSAFSKLIFWLLLLTFNLNTASAENAPRPTKKTAAHLVEAITLQPSESTITQKWFGSLHFNEIVRLYNQEEGRILAFSLREGETIKRNASILRLDDRLLRADREKKQAEISQAKTDVKRLQRLINQQVISADELDKAKTARAILEAEAKLLDIRLSYFKITAPFSGIVTERHINAGDAISKHTHLLTLANPKSLVVHIRVNEKPLLKLRDGQATTIEIPSTKQQYQGKILRRHPQLDPATRQGIVEVMFDTPPDNVFAGQSATVTLTEAKQERLLIPLAALQRDQQSEFVYLIDENNKAVRTPVTSGEYFPNTVEINSGIHVGAQIITRGFLGLKHGKLVKIIANNKSPKE